MTPECTAGRSVVLPIIIVFSEHLHNKVYNLRFLGSVTISHQLFCLESRNDVKYFQRNVGRKKRTENIRLILRGERELIYFQ
jgi:hypothetical protein